MDLIFNELSFTDKADNEHRARCIMEKLLLCCKAAREFIKDLSLRLRVNDDFFAQELTDGYSVSAWLNDPAVSKNLKILLLGLKRTPFIDEKVINSIPFNPNQKEFIKKILPDGKIEIVLTWTDQGLGCVIQTTGRNIHETYKISEILKKKYGR
ncbi:hypothetical protein [Desulfobacter sp.]